MRRSQKRPPRAAWRLSFFAGVVYGYRHIHDDFCGPLAGAVRSSRPSAARLGWKVRKQWKGAQASQETRQPLRVVF